MPSVLEHKEGGHLYVQNEARQLGNEETAPNDTDSPQTCHAAEPPQRTHLISEGECLTLQHTCTLLCALT